MREGRRASPQEGAPSCPLLTALLALCLALAPEAPRRRACSSPPLRGPGEPAASSKPHRSRAGHASRHAAEPTSGAGAGPPTAPELSAPPPSATPPVTVTAPLELEKVAFAADELEMWLDSSSAAGTRLAVESPILTPSVREAATSAWQAVVSVVTGRARRSGRCCSPGGRCVRQSPIGGVSSSERVPRVRRRGEAAPLASGARAWKPLESASCQTRAATLMAITGRSCR